MPPLTTLLDRPSPPLSLLPLLKSHLPHSLPLLRRIQSSLIFPSSSTPETHILFAFPTPPSSSSPSPPQPPSPLPTNFHFAAAHLSPLSSPETELYIYSTLEDRSTSINPLEPTLGSDVTDGEAELCTELVIALLRRVRRIECEVSDGGVERKVGRGKIVLGSVNEVVRRRLLERGVVMGRTPAADAMLGGEEGWEFCGKWLFRGEEMEEREGEGGLGEGLGWDVLRREDVKTVLGRTKIPRQELVAPPFCVVVALVGLSLG